MRAAERKGTCWPARAARSDRANALGAGLGLLAIWGSSVDCCCSNPVTDEQPLQVRLACMTLHGALSPVLVKTVHDAIYSNIE